LCNVPQFPGNIRAITVFHIRVRSTANEEAMWKSVQAVSDSYFER